MTLVPGVCVARPVNWQTKSTLIKVPLKMQVIERCQKLLSESQERMRMVVVRP